MQSLQGDLGRERFGLTGFPAVMARATLACALAERGEFHEGDRPGQDGVRIAEALESPVQPDHRLLEPRVTPTAVKGSSATPSTPRTRARLWLREWNLRSCPSSVTGSWGHAYAFRGEIAEGISLLQEALTARVLGLGTTTRSSSSISARRTCSPTGSMTRSHRRASVERSPVSAVSAAIEAWALHLLGRGRRAPRSARGSSAEGRYREALALAAELGMRPLVAHCHLGLAKLYRRTGKPRKPRSTSPPRRRCIARWTCGSGWSRRRWR